MIHVHPSAQSPPAVLEPTCQVQPLLSRGSGVKKPEEAAFPKALRKLVAGKR